MKYTEQVYYASLISVTTASGIIGLPICQPAKKSKKVLKNIAGIDELYN